MRSKIIRWVMFTFLLGWAVVQLYPVIWMYYSSLKEGDEIIRNVWSLPRKARFENWSIAWTGAWGNVTINRYTLNSLVVTFTALALVLVCAYFAGYALARYKFAGRTVITIFLLAVMTIPAHTIIIPLYAMLYRMGLVNNYFGLIFPYVAFSLPFTILLTRAYFTTFPREIEEAAKVDGCSELGAFLRVVVPTSKAIFATILVVTFPGLWNEYLVASTVITKNSLKTLPVGIALYKGLFVTEWDLTFAAISIASIPAIVIYFVLQKRITRGMVLGAVKG